MYSSGISLTTPVDVSEFGRKIRSLDRFLLNEKIVLINYKNAILSSTTRESESKALCDRWIESDDIFFMHFLFD